MTYAAYAVLLSVLILDIYPLEIIMKAVKSLLSLSIACFFIFFASGCVLFATQPTYTDEYVVSMPEEIRGSWIERDSNGETVRDVIFSGSTSAQSIKEGKETANLHVTFFKINNTLLSDFTLSEDAYDNLSYYQRMHLRRVHTVSRIELADNGKTLRFYPLKSFVMDPTSDTYKKFPKYFEMLQGDSSEGVAVNSSKEWVEFLLKATKNPAVMETAFVSADDAVELFQY